MELVRRLPKPITLILDGYDTVPVFDKAVEIVVPPPKTGAGHRWRVAAACVDSLAIVVDDDFLVDYSYVDRCVAAWARLQCPFAWAGFDRFGTYVKHSENRNHDTAAPATRVRE